MFNYNRFTPSSATPQTPAIVGATVIEKAKKLASNEPNKKI